MAVHSRAQCPGYLCEMLVLTILDLVNITSESIHEGSVVTFNLSVSRQAVRVGASLVHLQEITHRREKLALKITPLICKNLKGAPKPDKEFINCCCCSSDLGRLRGEGDAFYPFGELVDHDQDVFVSSLSLWELS